MSLQTKLRGTSDCCTRAASASSASISIWRFSRSALEWRSCSSTRFCALMSVTVSKMYSCPSGPLMTRALKIAGIFSPSFRGK